MNILGAFLRSDEIVGIGTLKEVYNGNKFYLTFSVITRSSSVAIDSCIVEDVNIATKYEQMALGAFKKEYQVIQNKIAIMIGDAISILQDQFRQDKLEAEYKAFCEASDNLSALIKKSKGRTKEEMLQMLGQLWVAGKEIKEMTL
jgi:hypothetical protein